MRTRTGLAAAVCAVLAAACGDKGGELRDATRARQAQLAAQRDSLKRDSAAAAQAANTDTAFAVPVFANVPPDTAKAAAVLSDTGAAPADTASRRPVPPVAAPPPTNAPGDWTTGIYEARRPGVSGTVTSLRAARNVGFDRVTLQFDGARVPGYHVEYARSPGSQCGSGAPLQVQGSGWLTVRLSAARAHDDAGRSTVAAREQTPGLPVIRELEMSCDFEGEVGLVVGVARPNRFRVTELANPARLVVDVQQ
jgi:hypothetical protein